MNYPIALPALSQLHNGIDPAIANGYSLNIPVVQGAPYLANDAAGAEEVVRILRAIQPHEPTISNAVLETAANRALKIREIATENEFPGQGNAAIMAGIQAIQNSVAQIQNSVGQIQNSVGQIQDELAEVKAIQFNIRVVLGNARLDASGGQLLLRRKEIPGNGAALTATLLNPAGVAPLHMPPVVNGRVNTMPAPAFSTDTGALTHNDVLRYIMFYNETFGITAGDSLAVRRNLVRRWLMY